MVSVIGGHKCDEKVAAIAERVGEIIAESGAVLVSGGLGGVMESACRGAKKAGGLTIGIVPGNKKEVANRYVDIVIPSDMGYSRNTLVAGAGDIVVAISGEYGTLSEICFSEIGHKKIYGLDTWDVPVVNKISSPEDIKSVIEQAMSKVGSER